MTETLTRPIVNISEDLPLPELLRAWAVLIPPSGDFVNEDLRRAADEIEAMGRSISVFAGDLLFADIEIRRLTAENARLARELSDSRRANYGDYE